MAADGLTAPALPGQVREVVADLAGLPRVRALRLGGSRARGRPTSPDSDWDLFAYVDELADAAALRTEIGARLRSGLNFELDTANGGHPLHEAELSVATSPRIDVCFRPIGHVLREQRGAADGMFTLYPYPKLPDGVPSYILLTELAGTVTLRGELRGELTIPAACPPELVRVGGPWWRGRAACFLLLATDHVAAGEPVNALGHIVAAVTSLAHARLLERGEWYPITKRLLNEPGAVAEPVRRMLMELSPAGLTTDAVRQVVAATGLDERTGLDWLAAGRHLGPGSHPGAGSHLEPGEPGLTAHQFGAVERS